MKGVLGMWQQLLESDLTPVLRQLAEIVERSGQHLLGIFNEILDFSRSRRDR